MPIPQTKEALRRTLRQGKLKPLGEVLHSGSSSEELVIAIDFLLRKDVAKFKRLYVLATCAKERKDLEKAVQEIYGMDLKGLDKGWREFINQSEGI